MADDIADIDAVSFAASTGQIAASHLYAMLIDSDAEREPNWFGRAGGESIEATVAAMAAFITEAGIAQGETLWREAMAKGWTLVRPQSWGAVSWERRQAYDCFVATTLQAWKAIRLDQERIERAAAALRRAQGQTRLKLEDSILEPTEPFDARLPGFEAPAPADALTPAAAVPTAGKPAKKLSIGESSVRPPEHRGGRGKRRDK